MELVHVQLLSLAPSVESNDIWFLAYHHLRSELDTPTWFDVRAGPYSSRVRQTLNLHEIDLS